MGAIWWTYGIGLKGREPTWQPAEPVTIVREASLLQGAEILESPLKLTGDVVSDSSTVASALQNQGWVLLEESDPRRGQAVAASDEIIQKKQKNLSLENICHLPFTTRVVSVGQK